MAVARAVAGAVAGAVARAVAKAGPTLWPLGGHSGFNVHISTRMLHRDFMKLLVNKTQVASKWKSGFL